MGVGRAAIKLSMLPFPNNCLLVFTFNIFTNLENMVDFLAAIHEVLMRTIWDGIVSPSFHILDNKRKYQ